MSERPVRSGVIAEELCKSLILSAVRLDDAGNDPWMRATRFGRFDFAEVSCTCRAIQTLEWLRSHNASWTRQIGKRSSSEDTASCV